MFDTRDRIASGLPRRTSGFPSPADDYVEGSLDLNAYLIRHPVATFFARVSGDAMEDAGLHDGDLLIVDRALIPGEGSIVVAVADGEFVVRRVCRAAGGWRLLTEDPFDPGDGAAVRDVEIWGVVTHVIHAVVQDGSRGNGIPLHSRSGRT